MIFWNYRLLVKRLIEKQILNTEKVIYVFSSFILGMSSFFILQFIAFFLWLIMMSPSEKRLMNKLSIGDNISTLLVLSFPSFIRQLIYGIITISILILVFFLLSLPDLQSDKTLSMILSEGKFLLTFLAALILILFIQIVTPLYYTYKALRCFSRLSFKAWDEAKNSAPLNKKDFS